MTSSKTIIESMFKKLNRFFKCKHDIFHKKIENVFIDEEISSTVINYQDGDEIVIPVSSCLSVERLHQWFKEDFALTREHKND